MKRPITISWAIMLFVALLSCEQEHLQLQNASTVDCGGCEDIPPGGGTIGQVPSIDSFSPTSGYAQFSNTGIPGTSVVVYGTNFSTTAANNVLKFNGTIATVNTATSTQITTTVPVGATTGRITVTTNSGTATSATDFVVLLINSWNPIADFGGLPRSAAVSFVLKNVAYVGTGFTSPSNNGNLVSSKDFWAYSPSTDTWTQRADFPGPARGAAVGFATDSRGYITLGSNGTAPYTMLDLWEYHPGRNTWTQKANFPGAGRVYSTAFAADGKGYVGTGLIPNGVLSDFWEYNPTSNQWTQKNNFAGGARAYAGSFVIDKIGYIGMGQTSQSSLRDLWVYNATADTWTQKASAPSTLAVGGTLLFGIGKKGYAGGSAGQLWMFDPGSNTWVQKANIPGSLVSAVAFSIEPFGYIGLGYDQISNSDTQAFYRYTPD